MSHSINLNDPITGQTIELDVPHELRGGAYELGGCTKAWLNVTYNYGEHYYRIFGEKGIRVIYGMTGANSIPVLESGAEQLVDDVSDDYWEATEGNAKRSLLQLIGLAKRRPDGIWDGD